MLPYRVLIRRRWNRTIFINGPDLGAILSPRGCLIVSDENFGCHNWIATRVWWVEVRDAIKHPTMHRTSTQNKDDRAQNVNSDWRTMVHIENVAETCHIVRTQWLLALLMSLLTNHWMHGLYLGPFTPHRFSLTDKIRFEVHRIHPAPTFLPPFPRCFSLPAPLPNLLGFYYQQDVPPLFFKI